MPAIMKYVPYKLFIFLECYGKMHWYDPDGFDFAIDIGVSFG